MANLKVDLLNELRNQKYYEELELLRLAQDPGMKYRTKVLDLTDVLSNIALLNNQIALAEGYFQDPQEQVQANQPLPNVPQPPEVKEEVKQEVVTQPLPGQSHGE